MTTYIVTFEVTDDSRKNALKEKLKTYGTFCPIHDNCWAIVSKQAPPQILSFLRESLVESDRIFVIRSGIQSAWQNIYGQKNSEWLKERL